MAKASSSESLQKKTAQIAAKGTARDVYMKAISERGRFKLHRHPARRSPSLGRGHRSRRLRFVVALLLMTNVAVAQAQNRT